jgi:propanol-preferring alcohol dehydrogenase
MRLTKQHITDKMGLPTSQKAAVKQGEGKSSTAPVKEVPVHEPGPGQILVKINWTGLCGSDKSLIYDEWVSQGLRMTPDTHGIAGHEGAGEVVAVHDDVKDLWNVGDRAGVKWVASVCKKCEFCTNGTDELHCAKQLNSGFSIQGTFAEYCLTDARYATRLPEGVSDEEAGPILCGGV